MFCSGEPSEESSEEYSSSDSSGSDDERSVSSEDSEEDSDIAVRGLDRALRHPVRTEIAARRCFKKFGTKEGDRSERALGPEEFMEAMPYLADRLRLPHWIFKDAEQMFERFDFDGDGHLTKAEFTKLVRRGLQQRRVALGGIKRQKHVPTSTIADSGYTVVKELGRGGQGIIYLCTWKPVENKFCVCNDDGLGLRRSMMRQKLRKGKEYCVKYYDKENANASDLDELIAEYNLMKEMQSDLVAKTYEVFQDRGFYYLVGEPYYGGDLTKLGKKAFDNGVKMTEEWWRRLYSQCLEGLAYLHSKAVIHCDIKEANIMLANTDYKDPRPVLIDFGLATNFGSLDMPQAGEDGVCSPAGTPGYIPPETWETEVWYPVGDVFSMGVVFFQTITAQTPGVSNNSCGVLQKGDEGTEFLQAARERPFPWDKFPAGMPLLKELITDMTDPNHKARLRAPTAMEHAWFKSDSNAKLPKDTIRDLVTMCEEHEVKDNVEHQLRAMNNLEELRHFTEEVKLANTESPTMGAAQRAVLEKYGVQLQVASDFVDKCSGAAGCTQLLALAQASVLSKENHCGQVIHDLFFELDTDNSGQLSTEELRPLLESSAFECPLSDVDELLTNMDADEDGLVSFEEFSSYMIKDGRVAGRQDADKLAHVNKKTRGKSSPPSSCVIC